MSQDHRYEAWRNFLLILAGVLIGSALTSLGNIKEGVSSIFVFDKTLDVGLWPSAISFLVVFYVFKITHGIIITIYSDDYFKRISTSRLYIGFSCLITTFLISWTALLVSTGARVSNGLTLYGRCWRLLLVVIIPTIMLVIFDYFYLVVFDGIRRYQKLGVWGCLKFVLKELCRSTKRRRNPLRYRNIWIIIDCFTAIVLIIWGLIMLLSNTPPTKIYGTLIILIIILIAQSVVDYIFNFNYYFFIKYKQPAQKS